MDSDQAMKLQVCESLSAFASEAEDVVEKFKGAKCAAEAARNIAERLVDESHPYSTRLKTQAKELCKVRLEDANALFLEAVRDRLGLCYRKGVIMIELFDEYIIRLHARKHELAEACDNVLEEELRYMRLASISNREVIDEAGKFIARNL